MKLYAVKASNGERVKRDEPLTFRGSGESTYLYRYATRPTTGGKSGKIVAYNSDSDYEQELYAHIFGLTVHAE